MYKHLHLLYIVPTVDMACSILVLVAFMLTVSDVVVICGSHSKQWARVRNNRLTFETMGSHLKRRSHV